LNQITALTKGGVKSSLDLSFGKVNLQKAEIQRRKTRNDVQADLIVALGR
jgi:hypothetical protein